MLLCEVILLVICNSSVFLLMLGLLLMRVMLFVISLLLSMWLSLGMFDGVWGFLCCLMVERGVSLLFLMLL